MKKKQLSIIIPQYNQAAMTERCIDLVLEMSTGEFELIVVDNGSTDEISATHKEQVKFIKNAENLMFAKGCNTGAQQATGDILCFLNNDIEVSSGWDSCAEIVRANSEIGLLGPKLIYPDMTIQHAGMEVLSTDINGAVFNHRYRHFDPRHPFVNQTRSYQCITGACVFVRAEDFEKVGGFDELYVNGYEDADLCFKIRLDLNKLTIYYPEVTLMHKESVTSSKMNYQEAPNKIRFFNKWGKHLVEDHSKWNALDKQNNPERQEI